MLLVLLVDLVLVFPITALVLAGLRVWRPLLVLVVPFSLAYGFILYRIGLGIATDWLRGHEAELLEAIGPRQTA